MPRPTAIEVYPLEDFFLKIKFDNNEIKLYDVKPSIKGAWYGKLANVDYFKTVYCDGFTVAWQEGQDLCPDDIYFLSQHISNN